MLLSFATGFHDFVRLGAVSRALLGSSQIRLLRWPRGLRSRARLCRCRLPPGKRLREGCYTPPGTAVTDSDISLVVRRLRRAELPADTVALARFLIGKIVVRQLPGGRISGRIVETEAYPTGDPAAHHYIGPTLRNRSMFLRRGHAYVYFSYGNHFMLNISAEAAGVGGGVLIRALEPLEGIAQMQVHRKTSELVDLTRGPGRLAAALRIDRSLDGVDVCAPGPLWLGVVARPKSSLTRSLGEVSMDALAARRRANLVVRKSTRIGIRRAAHRLLRFYERGSPFVSGPARLRS